jgi:hypothetical protein
MQSGVIVERLIQLEMYIVIVHVSVLMVLGNKPASITLRRIPQ